ncbi:MAG: alpha/beta fold hydrolase [Proteobacteria bacterium]|nr:alpha/beta fold hydrolase [Pseudomonadota bacterium]
MTPVGAAAPAPPPPATLQVGQAKLHHCATAAPWCGTLERPLDPSGVVPGKIDVYFEYYPRAGAAAPAGTLVATEGGPGFPATESREEYLALFEPLRATRDLVIMDNRGTGRSAAIACTPLQEAPVLSEANIGACGRSLGPSASLYGTALAGDDLAAILEALGTGPVDLYGDSYGTYFAQTFALRHPTQLRSLVLDGAYPLDGPDYPWYPHYAPAMREKFNRACERSPGCSGIPGNSMEHIAPALKLLREKPYTAHVRTAPGRVVTFSVSASQLATVMFGSAPALASVRETDAAARAYVGGDRAPLLRLMAESLTGVDSRSADSGSALKYSAGLAAAVSCGDPPQIFDMSLPPKERMVARDAAIARRESSAPETYAPFTIAEFRRIPLDYAFIDQCAQWPVPRSPPVAPVPADDPYPEIPVLVVSGDLDNMTPVADGAAAAARFPRAHHVVLANGFHVNALPHSRSECGAKLVRRFIENLSTGDDGCAAEVPPVRLVTKFARTAAELPPARGMADNAAGEPALRVVTAALLTSEDVISRAQAQGAGSGLGLRGGSFTVADAAGGYRIALDEVRWTEDVSVSGTVDWAGRSGAVRGVVRIKGPRGASGPLEFEWTEGGVQPRATVSGKLGGESVTAEAPAP